MSAVRVLVVDNYDSFTFNLVQYLAELGAETTVWRNDAFTLDQVEELAPAAVVISPGPCTPAEAGESVALIKRFGHVLPILGVCLGHQAIGAAYGAKVVRAAHLMHGKTSSVQHDGSGVFDGLDSPLTATRYHSLVVEDLPDELIANAWVDEDVPVDHSAVDRTVSRETGRVLMGVRHARHPVWGVQFHPESVLTEHGHAMLASFLSFATEYAEAHRR